MHAARDMERGWRSLGMGLLYAVLKEFHLLTALHRRTVVIMAAVPFAYTLLFGALFYENTLVDVPVLVCNRDEGAYGRQLVRDLTMTPEIRVEEQVVDDGDERELARCMMKHGAAGTVVIPENFSRDIARGEPASVALIVDNSNTSLGGTAMKAVQSVVSQWDDTVLTQQRRAAGWTSGQTGGLQVVTRMSGNPTGGYEDFFLVVLVLHASQLGTIFSLGPSMVLERKRRRRRWERHTLFCLLAKFVIYVPVALLFLSICLAFSFWCFGLVNRGSFLPMLLLVTAYLGAVVAFAICVGSWVRKSDQAITYVLFYVMPSVLFTGAIWPRYDMDSISLALSYLVPVGYVADDMRNLLLLGSSSGLWHHIGVLCFMACLFLSLAFLGIRHGRQKAEQGKQEELPA